MAKQYVQPIESFAYERLSGIMSTLPSIGAAIEKYSRSEGAIQLGNALADANSKYSQYIVDRTKTNDFSDFDKRFNEYSQELRSTYSMGLTNRYAKEEFDAAWTKMTTNALQNLAGHAIAGQAKAAEYSYKDNLDKLLRAPMTGSDSALFYKSQMEKVKTYAEMAIQGGGDIEEIRRLQMSAEATFRYDFARDAMRGLADAFLLEGKSVEDTQRILDEMIRADGEEYSQILSREGLFASDKASQFAVAYYNTNLTPDEEEQLATDMAQGVQQEYVLQQRTIAAQREKDEDTIAKTWASDNWRTLADNSYGAITSTTMTGDSKRFWTDHISNRLQNETDYYTREEAKAKAEEAKAQAAKDADELEQLLREYDIQIEQYWDFMLSSEQKGLMQGLGVRELTGIQVSGGAVITSYFTLGEEAVAELKSTIMEDERISQPDRARMVNKIEDIQKWNMAHIKAMETLEVAPEVDPYKTRPEVEAAINKAYWSNASDAEVTKLIQSGLGDGLSPDDHDKWMTRMPDRASRTGDRVISAAYDALDLLYTGLIQYTDDENEALKATQAYASTMSMLYELTQSEEYLQGTSVKRESLVNEFVEMVKTDERAGWVEWFASKVKIFTEGMEEGGLGTAIRTTVRGGEESLVVGSEAAYSQEKFAKLAEKETLTGIDETNMRRISQGRFYEMRQWFSNAYGIPIDLYKEGEGKDGNLFIPAWDKKVGMYYVSAGTGGMLRVSDEGIVYLYASDGHLITDSTKGDFKNNLLQLIGRTSRE